MRIAVLSDIHGNFLALQAVANDLKRRGVDRVVNLGDLVSGPLWPAQTLAFLMQQPWLTIAGNHEHQLMQGDSERLGLSDRHAWDRLSPQGKDWLKALPGSAQLDTGSGRVLLCHGSPRDETEYLLETVENGQIRPARPADIWPRLGSMQAAEPAALILCGHSRMPRIVQLEGGPLLVNPGSVGLAAYEDTGPNPHIVEAGSPHARYATIEPGA